MSLNHNPKLLILSLDTSTSACSVALTERERVLGEVFFDQEKSHSEKIHDAITQLLIFCDKSLEKIDVFAISAGPGSYTGLRIGFSVMHGFCMALNKPLVSINTLDAMAEQVRTKNIRKDLLLAPMIDARRMEVYNLIKNFDNEVIVPSRAEIITPTTFSEFTEDILYFGNGAAKCRKILQSKNLHYIPDINPRASDVGRLAHKKLADSSNKLNNLPCTLPLPFYLKEVHIGKCKERKI